MKLTERSLENAAVFYLRRYSSTKANLGRVLQRKIDRARRLGDERELPEGAVDRVVERMVAAGFIDDAGFAKAWTRTLHMRGLPARGIASKLRMKGVQPEQIEEALARLSEEVEDPELQAARAYARRRRFGVYRTRDIAEGEERKQQQRDLAAMGRAGFPYGIARRVLEEEEEDA